MKTLVILKGSLRLFAIAALIALALQPTTATAQTINIGPNQYAFRFTVNPNYGLFFNATNTAYDFRNGLGNAVWSINADNGQLRNDLYFAPGFTHRVPANNWAIRSATAPNAGIFFGPADFEFRIANGSAGWTMNAASGNSIFGGTISAPGGNSTQWNQAVAWGNHASAGYLSAETDPQVGALSSNDVPRWNGTQLASSILTANPNIVEINSPSTTTLFTLNTTAAAGNPMISIRRSGAQVAYFQQFNSDLYLTNQESGSLFLRTDNVTRLSISSTGYVSINGAPSTVSPLYVRRTTTGTTGGAIEAEVDVDTNSDVRAVRGRSVTAPGWGYGVEGTGGFYGVRGTAEASDYSGTAYGVAGFTSGTGVGTRIGIYGNASGGTTNWAGYFVGNQYVSGDLRVGNTGGATGYKLAVNGKIICTEARVQALANWPDYVFGESYTLMSLEDLETFVKTEKHLPGVPSAAEVEAEQGFDLGDMQKITLEKIEELTLHLIEQNKLIKQQQAEIEWLKSQVKQ